MRNPKITIIDNYDSFTYNLFDYFCQLGTDCRVLRNNELTLAEFCTLDFDGLVLSPGPKRPADAGHLMELIHFFHDKKPILGICLGHQGIGEYFGARLCNTAIPMHGKTSMITHNEHPLFEAIPKQYQVMRYHSLALEGLEGTPLDILATTTKGEIMAIAHKQWPVYGVQFHPESILTDYGIVLLENWLSLVTCHHTTNFSTTI
jgi:anthranilate synthase/aminodeoxychorismate synthase-like glutamine amidotransferase